MESLEHAQMRTLEFLALVKQEFAALGVELVEEPFIAIAEKIVPYLVSPEEHYELREQVTGAFSSAAYKYLTRKWRVLNI